LNPEERVNTIGKLKNRELRTDRLDYANLDVRDALVPIDGSEASFDALALACQLSKTNKGTVYAVYVIEVARALPLDAELAPEATEGEQMLQKAEAIAEKLGYKVSGEILQARDAGHAIVDEAIERSVDAIIFGVDYTTPLGEFELDPNAVYVVQHAPCRVILWRAASQGVEA
jgi:nucleotide-binding universal stress UspA family protein